VKHKASTIVGMAAALMGAGMVAGIGNAHREVLQREADGRDRERIDAAKAKRERKAAKRLAETAGLKGSVER